MSDDKEQQHRRGNPLFGRRQERLYETVKIGGSILGKTSTGVVVKSLQGKYCDYCGRSFVCAICISGFRLIVLKSFIKNCKIDVLECSI